MQESKFQARLIKELESMFPGAVIFKTDPRYIQGFPDLMILYKKRWAALECKKETKANRQPNQEYYVNTLDNMSFSRFICPENKEEVLHDLQQTFEPRRAARVPRGK